jgi:predicted RNA-binding protein with PUA-like domain
MPKGKQFWLVKQEPEAYSWADFMKDGRADWTGIRNFAARNHLRSMKKGDWVFFYHSVSEKQVVGIAAVTKEAFPDPTASEGDWSAVELAPVKPVSIPVTLAQLKSDPVFAQIGLIKQSRLSAMPVTPEQARRLLTLAKTKI